MGKKLIAKLSLIVLIIILVTGGFLIYQVAGPEIEYIIYKPDVNMVMAEYEKEEIKGNRLLIPSIGVDTEIGTEERYLDKGGWVQERYEDIPSLIAIHRFGWGVVTTEDKVKHTLYHVNKLKQGDKVMIFWNDRKYEYIVEEVFESYVKPETEEDVLYLYTCKFWDSEERVFVRLETA